jgi:sulfate adenylyltransferase subunit 2
MKTLSHLDRLEAESIHIFREVASEFKNPVLLYSIGKDSTVLLHLMRKAFFPARPPIPLLHIDSTFEFRDTYVFRDQVPERCNVDLRVYINQEGVRQGINPFDHGATVYTDIMRTQALREALDQGGYDCAIGGARRDEEKSRAKERIFSFRSAQHRWDPKVQRPELWNLYNTRIHKGESVRAFPISNWTELDIWLYILRENIPLPDLYFARKRPVVVRDGVLIMVDDERMQLLPGEVLEEKMVRFRTLGCYPLTGGVESQAETLEQVVAEILTARTSERQGRVIDHDPSASMEKKKQEGYF